MPIRQRLTPPHLHRNSMVASSTGFIDHALNFSDRHFFIYPAEILHAAITVGKLSTTEFENAISSEYGLADAISRIYMVMANVNFGCCCDSLTHSDLFNQSDPTEKAMVNYYLGMMFTKLFADRLLQIPWLAHYSWMSNSGHAQLHSGRSTPDLLGFSVNTGRWNSFEAKGRNSSFNPEVIVKAKTQASRWIQVHGNTCDLKIGAGLFRGPRQALEFHWDDPEENIGEEPIILKPNVRVWKNYYRAALFLHASERDVSGVRVKISPIIREHISMLTDNDAWESNRTALTQIFEYSLARRKEIADEQRVFVGLDGIEVSVDA